MPRARLVRRFSALVLTTLFIAGPIGDVFAAAPQDSSALPENQNLTPERKFARRYPQPVKVGFLIGLPVLDAQKSTYGYVSAVVRTAEGKILLVVPYRGWLGWAPTDWGRRNVAVPIEKVAIQGRQIAALDFAPEDFAAAAAYAGEGTALPAAETIRIAVSR
ncbi:MAG TPA: PRC-barrel domain-containing protein [Xanthobacteraceae bacterium]|nr:PRC-barrel domain-containing protein [Xanthobacteraceae bacterium]